MGLPNIIQQINSNINEINTIKSTYLPLSGGTMTGAIKTKHSYLGVRDVNTDRLVICGGTTSSDGAYIRLSGKNESNPRIDLSCVDANGNTKVLCLKPSGSLTWGGNEIATRDVPTYVAADTLTAPAVSGKLCVVKASKDNAPNNGMILSTYTNASWWGQLYIGDNSTQGIYYRGMSDGVVGEWYRLLDNGKCKSYVTTTWTSGNNWYRKYSDGWIEQGGYIGRQVTVTTNFNIAFTSTPTVICGCVYNRASTFYAREVYPNTVSTTAFTITNSIPAGATSDYIKWYACGY